MARGLTWMLGLLTNLCRLRRHKGIKKTMMLDLNEKDLKNLFVFLSRANLTGSEVDAFVELTNKIRSQQLNVNKEKDAK
jgi:hypothetical protein